MSMSILRAVAPIVVLTGGWFGFQTIGQRPDPPQREPEEDQGQLVETVTVEEATDGLMIDADGLVIPDREVTLSAEVAGRVTKKKETLSVGRHVTKGEELYQIDPDVYETAFNAAEAELEQAIVARDEVDGVERPNVEALMKLAKRRVEIAERDLERVRTLRRSNDTTQAVVESAERAELQVQNEYTTLENQLRMLDSKKKRLAEAVKVAEARRDSAKRDFARSKVLAPASGIVIVDHVEENAFVQRGEPLLVIEDTQYVEVRSNLTLEQMAWLWRDERAVSAAPPKPAANGDQSPDENADDGGAYKLPPVPVKVSFDLAGRTYEWDANFCRYDGLGLDEKTRTVPCRIDVPKPREVRIDGTTAPNRGGVRALMRGMYVDVRANVRPTTPLLRIPERAVKPGGHVWRVAAGNEGENLLDVVPVEVAHREAGWVYVTRDGTPLVAGDRLVTSPLSNPEPGVKLRVVDDEGASSETTDHETTENTPADERSTDGDTKDGER